jgi:ParB-like chromosome segregation protein Spo0J
VKVVEVPLESLTPYAKNSRTHSEAQVAQIAASIEEFGWTNPILVDGERGIIAGHGRVLAARKLGLKKVPTIELSGMTEAQKRAYIIADNKLALNAGWDDAMLGLELGELADLGFNLSLTGFEPREIEALSVERQSGRTDPSVEWEDMPEFDQQDKQAFRSIVLHFKSQAEVDHFARSIGQVVSEKARFVWFSGTEIERYADKAYG